MQRTSSHKNSHAPPDYPCTRSRTPSSGCPSRRSGEWLDEAREFHDTCVEEQLYSQPDISDWGKGEAKPIMYGDGARGALDRCQMMMLNDANRLAQAQFPGTNVFTIRTDLGIGWYVAELVAQESLSSVRWPSGYYDYHTVVFRGEGHLYLVGREGEHERRWRGNAQRNGDTVDFW
ncbi:hypothetical protein A1Q1_07291 [Trichosporon asahii var. asahii CBS 2479]|uniref:Uncharacterized protein n=1 Tax=Trichosporon asahii var. asahii (strain ATCC 90039 / CBS 2479 / JCM 2466 / KCTC 7840 / NBRC 103889/ NCYC 2677 / UAMH 7654) TaxID=1186058 RepID=J6F3I1_TRIAS|nr:hypothetical protein A1Q1_07291 [Trichosporon asahii var. asahii CBS 2479]EJT51529.1 hypothetical protein A1Q1_07291 [Trichosporon asahii var. asahii CBS 2479]